MQLMPHFNDLGLQAPVKEQNMAMSHRAGPTLPNFKKSMYEMREDELLGPDSIQKETRGQNAMNGMMPREAANGSDRSYHQMKVVSAEYEQKAYQNKGDSQPPAKSFHGEALTTTGSQSGHPYHGQLREVNRNLFRRKIAPHEYACGRASGVSAGPQNQQSEKCENERTVPLTKTLRERQIRRTPIDANKTAEGICPVCSEEYSWDDQMIFTKCCDTAIGSQCQAEHTAETGECWNCGEEEVQSEAVSETKSWVSYDPKDFKSKAPARLPLYVTLFPSNGSSESPSVSAAIASNTASGPPSQDLTSSHSKQPLLLNISEEQCAREAVTYQSQNIKDSSKDVMTTPQSSLMIRDGDMDINSYNSHREHFDKSTAAPSESRSSIFNGSESVSSNESQDGAHSVISNTQERQDAKQYVIEATKHLVEMCNSYGNIIDEEDKDEVIDVFLEAIRGCKTFQAAIEKRILESAAPLATQPASAQDPATVKVSSLKPDDEETYCSKCEELEFRMEKAADALRGL